MSKDNNGCWINLREKTPRPKLPEYYNNKSEEKLIKQLKAENEELKEKLELANEDIRTECTRCALTNKLEQCLDEIKENIEYIEATSERIDDDNYIALACRIAETSRNILQLIKQAMEGEDD